MFHKATAVETASELEQQPLCRRSGFVSTWREKAVPRAAELTLVVSGAVEAGASRVARLVDSSELEIDYQE